MKIISILLLSILLAACNGNKQPAANHNVPSMEKMPGMNSDSAAATVKALNSKEKESDAATGEIKLSDQQVQLGNIHTDTINNGMLGDKLILTATLNIDQMKSSSISARVMGRIEKLYFKNTGEYVKKGDHIFDLYSEELNNAKQELIAALEQKNSFDNAVINFNQLIQSAKYKLLLWGMSETQINELAGTRKTTPTTAFYSNANGYITALDMNEGDYTMEGSTIMRLADLSTVWAEAQVYASQLSQIDRSGIAEVQLPDMPGKPITGKIEFVNPEINPDTRINLIRVSIPNTGYQLRPGMPAYVLLKSRQHQMLSLPIDAVIRDGKGATVWIQTGKNTYQSRMVETGMEAGERIEIRSGLKAGDIVVVTGAYLLNSEYIFKNGANPMEGMKM